MCLLCQGDMVYAPARVYHEGVATLSGTRYILTVGANYGWQGKDKVMYGVRGLHRWIQHAMTCFGG